MASSLITSKNRYLTDCNGSSVRGSPAAIGLPSDLTESTGSTAPSGYSRLRAETETHDPGHQNIERIVPPEATESQPICLRSHKLERERSSVLASFASANDRLCREGCTPAECHPPSVTVVSGSQETYGAAPGIHARKVIDHYVVHESDTR